MATLFDYMILTLRLLGGLRSGMASAGTTTTLTDTLLRLEDDDYWNGGTIWILTAGTQAPEGEYKLITDFASGVFTFNTLSSAAESGDKYAASEGKYPYDVLVDAVNLALSQYVYPRIDTTLTITADTEYVLPTAVQHGRLREVYRATTADANDRQFIKVGEWWTVETGSGQLLIVPEALPNVGYVLRLDYDLVHTDFDAGDDDIYEILEPKHIIYRAAEFMLLQQMYDGDEWPYLEERMNYFIDKADRYDAEFLEKIRQHRRE